jgi:proteasome accessory factor B
MANIRSESRLPPTERRAKLQALLHAHPGGLGLDDLASALFCDRRTIQRDLAYLRDLLNENPNQVEEPLKCTDGRYSLRPGEYPLSPVSLSIFEARALLFAARQLAHHASTHDPDTLEALQKIAGAFSGPMADRFQDTIDELLRRPAAATREWEHIHRLVRAWTNGYTVRLRYRALERSRPEWVEVDPYFLEPGKTNATAYLVGWTHQRQALRTYGIDRILEVEPTFQRFQPRELREAIDGVADSWSGTLIARDEHHIVLEFEAAAAVRARESHWHRIRVIETLEDGRLRMTLDLPSTMDFVPWVLGWGADVTVIAPASLRDDVAAKHRAAAARYGAAFAAA